jgi:hypothetical protein
MIPIRTNEFKLNWNQTLNFTWTTRALQNYVFISYFDTGAHLSKIFTQFHMEHLDLYQSYIFI